MASTFGAAFDKLDHDVQRQFAQNMNIRRGAYMGVMGGAASAMWMQYIQVILLGDTPGPGRPNDPNYHHTPFYSTKNSSFWLNKQLVEAGVDERRLVWFNTTLADGTPLAQGYVTQFLPFKPKIICLGGKAADWVRRIRPTPVYDEVYHPQYAKRFKSKEPYALIELLKGQVLDGIRGQKK